MPNLLQSLLIFMLPLYGERLACTAYGQINFPFLSAAAQKRRRKLSRCLVVWTFVDVASLKRVQSHQLDLLITAVFRSAMNKLQLWVFVTTSILASLASFILPFRAGENSSDFAACTRVYIFCISLFIINIFR
jgi:hypothetical protein